jgi:transcriptional regulator with XRE-family HTH domain
MTSTTAPRVRRQVLGGAARRIRELQNLTQAEIADACTPLDADKAVSHTTISHIEAGRRQPSEAFMYRLAAALKCDVDDITYLAPVYEVLASDAAEVA